ncbi:hypothetical protein [Pontibacter virosus]|uniref:O-antigen ligase-like membrane protein n=1 Tax=Pontibacter virosus TaxID=1765052 RepID=A0A2U1AQI9_9BACT|nr:hypothetical protein [Pontibacter virosus]PVY38674.1 hypothetical protein C8E01_11511 [Pontibacter virosus]
MLDTVPYAGIKKTADGSQRLLKQGIWLYFLLLLFEGALRKWFLPALATPLLLVRDPLALWLVFETWRRGLLPANFHMVGMVMIGIIGTYTALGLGHGSMAVAGYGARILLLHVPLIFVIGRIFNREDVLKVGKVTLWIAIPMALLIGLQFFSNQSAWVNRGVGGDVSGAGFSGALGYLRPPGTFSFTNGTTLFFAFVASYVCYFWLNPLGIHRTILIGATICLLVAIPLSISRGLFFHIGVSVFFALFATSRNPRYMGRMIAAVIGIGVVLTVLGNNSFFQIATSAFSARFETANMQEGGLGGVLLDRYLGGMVGALTESSEQPFFGYGIGMGTNVGSMLLTGKFTYLVSEGEWGRLIGELGPLMGIGVIILRISLIIKVGKASFRRLSEGDLLPWMMLSFGIMVFPQGQWSQPTSLGFCTLSIGLIIASLRTLSYEEK